MRGKVVVMKPGGTDEENFRKPNITETPIGNPLNLSALLDVIKDGLDGGDLEHVKDFTRWDGERCVAFCDEHGKNKKLPYNYYATTMLWINQSRDASQGGNVFLIHQDWIAGPLVIIVGDDELLRAL
jgi:hypothetical protein